MLKYNGFGGATIYGPWFDDDKFLYDNFELGYASMKKTGSNSLRISDLILGGKGYSGIFSYDGEVTLNFDNAWYTDKPKTDGQQIAELQEQLSLQQKRYEEQIAILQSQYEERIKIAENETKAALTAAAAAEKEAAAAATVASIKSVRLAATGAPGSRGTATAGAVIDMDDLDLSKAEMSLAGPDRIYVTNIYYSGVRLSVLLKYNGEYGATIYGPWFDDDKFLYDSFEFGYASLEKTGTDTLLISDLILGGAGYTGTFAYDGVVTLNYKNGWTSEKPLTADQRVAEVENQLALVQKRYEEQLKVTKELYNTETDGLKAELAAALKAATDAGVSVATVEAVVATASLPTFLAHSGFTGGRSLMGDWTVDSSKITQTDAGQFFAKFQIPLAQSASQTLYSFTAKAAGSGYSGYGLHFFASNDKTGEGYGFGKSYLVWVTSDPDFYKTSAPYIQIYESFNDGRMVPLASAAVSSTINRSNTTKVLYNKATGLIEVAVNGVNYLSFEVDTPIRSGDKMALRALGGPVTFTDLSVRTK